MNKHIVLLIGGGLAALSIVAGGIAFSMKLEPSKQAPLATKTSDVQKQDKPGAASSIVKREMPVAPAAKSVDHVEAVANIAPAPDPCVNIAAGATTTMSGVTGATSITIPAGCKSKDFSLRTSDGSVVKWYTSPFGAFVWPSGAGSGTDNASVTVHPSFEGGPFEAPAISYHLETPAEARPGTFEESFYIENSTTGQGSLYTVRVTVVAR